MLCEWGELSKLVVPDDLESPDLCLVSAGPVSVPAKNRGGLYDRYFSGFGGPPYETAVLRAGLIHSKIPSRSSTPLMPGLL